MSTFEKIEVKAKIHAKCVVGNYLMIKVKNNAIQGIPDPGIPKISGILLGFLSVR